MEGNIGTVSSIKYVTVIFRYQEDGGFELPTKKRLVKDVLYAYAKMADTGVVVADTRMVLGDTDQENRRCWSDNVIGSCDMSVFEFVFQCRSVSVEQLEVDDITITDVIAATIRRKGNVYTKGSLHYRIKNLL